MSDERLYELLEKIAKELEIANRLKIFEIVSEHHSWPNQGLEKMYDKAEEFENLIYSRLKK